MHFLLSKKSIWEELSPKDIEEVDYSKKKSFFSKKRQRFLYQRQSRRTANPVADRFSLLMYPLLLLLRQGMLCIEQILIFL